MIADYSENHTKSVNKLCGRISEFLNITTGVTIQLTVKE